MKTRHFFLFLFFIATSFLRCNTALAQEAGYLTYAGKEQRSFAQMMDDLSKADVVFVGEQHDHKLGHSLELDIFKALHGKTRSIALSLEMFERDTQLVLDEYLKGQISQASFLSASRPWPNYKTDYAPLVEFCKENKLSLIAANAPRRYVSTVGRNGLTSLTDLSKDSLTFLPKLPISMELPPGYNKALDEVFSNHGTGGSTQAGAQQPGMASPQFMKEGEALWDATMAGSILKGRKNIHAKLILQMNGSMHCESGYGIVARLRAAAPRRK